jgi:pimeloyl-ACP methyl ester carboxylesterase
VTAAASVLLAFLVVAPVVSAMWLAGKPREPLSPATLPIAYSDVTLHASDGVRLSGWYVPSRNGAAVVLVHGGGGDRNGVRRQALVLARRGFGVLLYDERGRGRSGGTPQAMGWNWVPDVEAAVDYLERRPGVRRVGVLGLSTGAEVAVTAAAHDVRIDAVVAEGLISRSLDDTRHLSTGDQISGIPYWWVAFHALELETGTHPPEPLTEALRAVAPRPLLIIAAAENPPERAVAPAYVRAAGPTAEYWLARTGHTQALESFPRLYEQRVAGLFERALLRR